VSVRPHPLDPLTGEELAAAVEILAASGRTNAGSRLSLIALREPPKEDVLGFVPGQPIRREAFVVVYERAANRTFEAAIDLGARQVRSWTQIPGVQPPILTEEYALTGDIVRHDALWQAAMSRRGISDLSNVYVDPWPAGEALSPEERNRRIVKAVAYYKASSHNAYARPIEGVIAVVDLTAKRVIRLLDSGVVPLETTPRELDEASLAPQREPPHSLEIIQPHGPSFTIAGALVRWQKWQFRFGMHPREGLVLYTVAY
jgi:primary-amine oxidase